MKLFNKSPDKPSDKPVFYYDLLATPPLTEEQRFRQNTIGDIRHLENAGKKDLAQLEAQKLITHLKTEYDL
jgi:hypothetical protein